MRILLAIAFGFGFLCLGARSAHAQATCCGDGGELGQVVCSGGCGRYWLYYCTPDPQGNEFFVKATVCSGASCDPFQTWEPVGYCYNGQAVSSPQPLTQDSPARGDAAVIYVDAYERACTGRYVPVRMVLALPGP